MVPATYDVTPQPPARTRRMWIILVALAVVAVVAVTAVVVLLTRSDDQATTAGTAAAPTATLTPSPSPKASPTPTVTPQPTPTLSPIVEGALRRLGTVVQAASWGRAEVGAVMGPVTSGCGLEPWQASQRLADVVTNRETALAQVSGFPLTGEPDVDEAAALLQSALNYSLQADRGYLRWVDETYSQYFYEHTTWPEEPDGQPVTSCPGPAPRSTVLDEADRLSDSSQDSKDAFVARYNPLAEQYGLPTLSAREF